jgi:dTDP-4-dehydrorhamnose reductase
VKPRILLTGCHGRLGQHLLRVLLENAEIAGIDTADSTFVAHPSFHYFQSTGVGRSHFQSFFKDFRPDAVINAAAWTDVDGAEVHKSSCNQVNVNLVQSLVDLCRVRNVWLGHVSTDYVFGGSAGPYKCDDLPHPLGYYGQSKLTAENLLRGAVSPVAIFRTIVLFGKGYGLKPDFLEWVSESLKQGKTIKVVQDQIGNCCWARDLANTMYHALQSRKTGLYHVASHGDCSRYDLAFKVADVLSLDSSLIKPAKTADLVQKAARPLKGGLVLESSELALGQKFPDLDDTLEAWKSDYPDLWSAN